MPLKNDSVFLRAALLKLFFAPFTARLLRYVLRTVLAYVQNAPGILVRFLRQNTFYLIALQASSLETAP